MQRFITFRRLALAKGLSLLIVLGLQACDENRLREGAGAPPPEEGRSETDSEDCGLSHDDKGEPPEEICPIFEAGSTTSSFLCSVPHTCSGDCSDEPLQGPFDARGCLKPRCDQDSDCNEDELCFVASHCGAEYGCFPGYLGCRDHEDATGALFCGCEVTDDCAAYDGWCVPADAYPDDCTAIEDSLVDHN